MKHKCKFDSLLWIGTVCIFAVLLISHAYNDILATARHGINFWDILLDGNFFAFYDLNVSETGNAFYTTVQPCVYNILLYIIFAIWNLPLYLLERFAGVDVMNNIVCLVYIKLLPVMAMVLTAILVKKILEALHVPQNQHNLMLYFYISSSLLTTVIFITAQYDILSLVLQLLGVYAFIKGEDKRFVIWFGIAICFKFFALVIFIPLMLLRYKKLWQWIKCFAAVIAVLLPTKLPFLIYETFFRTTSAAPLNADEFTYNMMKNLLISSKVNISLNLFVVVYAMIVVWAYLQENNNDANASKCIWVCMVSYAAFFGLMNAYPYWSVLLAPFVTLAIAISPKHIYINTILETVGYAGLVGANMLKYDWVYFGNTLKPMIWSRILQGTRFSTDFAGSHIYNTIMAYARSSKDFSPIANSVFIAAILALAYITYPKCVSSAPQVYPNPKEYRDVLVVRFLVNAVICLLPVIAIFI